jgi:hypothetical protein
MRARLLTWSGASVSRVARLFSVAVAVNFTWEMAQMSLYAPAGSWVQDSAGCLRASLGDGGIVLAIHAAGALFFRRLDWFRRPRVSGYAVMLTMDVHRFDAAAAGGSGPGCAPDDSDGDPSADHFQGRVRARALTHQATRLQGRRHRGRNSVSAEMLAAGCSIVDSSVAAPYASLGG